MHSIAIQIIILIASFVFLIKGADLFVKGASSIAHRLGVSQIIIGLTIVAMGTSAPEAAVSISGAWTGNADIAIGNIVGSNIINILLILGITSVIAKVSIAKSAVRLDIPMMLLITLMLIPMGLLGHSLDLGDGIIMLVLFTAYMIYLFRGALKNRKENEDRRPTYGQGGLWMVAITVIGLAMIIIGSKFTVSSATEIATFLGVSKRMIGLTVVAFGTSLPELVTSATAARRGEAGIAIGNIVGSNIFNILLVLGLTAVITPIPFVNAFIPDLCVASFAALLLCVAGLWKREVGRLFGALCLLCYAAYFAVLLFQR